MDREPSKTIKENGLSSFNEVIEITGMTYKQLLGMYRKNEKAFMLLLKSCATEIKKGKEK